jgi:hypothetical protein
MSNEYLGNFIPIYTDQDYFEISWSKTIVSWCIDYYNKYKEAPQQEIKQVFENYKKKNKTVDEDTIEAISKFLLSLSSEWERASKFNAAYLLDQTVTHFKKRSVELLNQDVEYLLETGDFQEAENRITNYHKVELSESNVYEPFSDPDGIKSVFAEEKQRCRM